MKRILIDMDDVLADASEGILSVFNERNNLELDKSFFQDKSFYEYMRNDQFVSYRDVLFKPGFFANLKVMPGAVEVVEQLQLHYEIYIVSAAMEFPNSLVEKYYWMEKNFPFISWKNIILCGDKTPIIGDYLIDDHEKNLKSFKGKALLFDAMHNAQIKGYQRFYSWKEIGQYFLGDQ